MCWRVGMGKGAWGAESCEAFVDVVELPLRLEPLLMCSGTCAPIVAHFAHHVVVRTCVVHDFWLKAHIAYFGLSNYPNVAFYLRWRACISCEAADGQYDSLFDRICLLGVSLGAVPTSM